VILNFSRARDENVAVFGDKFISVGKIHGLVIQPYLCLKTLGDRAFSSTNKMNKSDVVLKKSI